MPVLVFAPARRRRRSSRRCSSASRPCVGHVFSVFVGLQGREGRRHRAPASCSASRPAAVGVVRWRSGSLIVWLTGYVSLGSIVARGRLCPFAVYFMYPGRGGKLVWIVRAAGRGDHLVPPRQHPAAARRAPRIASAGARRRHRDAHRRAGRRELGHDAGRPAGARRATTSGSGPTSPRWSRPSTRRTRTRCSCRARRSRPSLRAVGDAGEAVPGAARDRLGGAEPRRCASVLAARARRGARRAPSS